MRLPVSRSAWKLPVVSGVLLVLAYYGRLLVPNFIAFVPMLVWIEARRDRPMRELARGAMVFGLTAYGISLHWIYAMLAISGLAVLMYVGLVVLFTAGAVAALTLTAWLRRRTSWSFGILLPLCWIPFEWLRTWGDLRMTADHVGHTLAGFPFVIQFADLVGPFGVGAFVLACNGLLHGSLLEPHATAKRRARAQLALLALAVLAYDTWAWTHPPRVVAHVRVAIVQPNIPLVLKWDPAQDANQEKILAESTRRAAQERPDLIVWPESARPTPVRHRLDRPATLALPEVQALARETGADILTGVEYARIESDTDFEYFNAALVVRKDGTIAPEWTGKTYLVPFTEGVPFRALLGPLLDGLGGDLHWLSGGFTPVPRPVPLPAAGWQVGVLVCYEEFYFDLARNMKRAGADFQVVITNDAWFGRTVFQGLLADVVRMRAIENRMAFVRVADTGYSGFVDPMGRYHDRTDLFVPAVEVRDVPITEGRTVYTRCGDVVAWLAVAGCVLAVLIARRGRSRGFIVAEGDAA